MRDLSLHLLDILENSAKAGAGAVRVRFSGGEDTLILDIEDDGPGFPEQVLRNPGDPDQTTRRDRPVGLGLSLLRLSAEQTGGVMRLADGEEGGARLHAAFRVCHVDARPLGDLTATIESVLRGWPGLDIVVELDGFPDRRALLDTAQMRRELDGVPLDHPDVRAFLRRCLVDGLRPLSEWAEREAARALETTPAPIIGDDTDMQHNPQPINTPTPGDPHEEP